MVALNGSLRKKGNTSLLIRQVLREPEAQGIETEMVHLKGAISGCIACNKCFKNGDGRCAIDHDIVNQCIVKMALAEVMIMGLSTYFADIKTIAHYAGSDVVGN